MAFWRSAGDEEFASATFALGEGGLLEARIDTAPVSANKIEYYLAVKTAGRVCYLPESVPASFFSAVESAPAAAPEKVPAPAPASPGEPAEKPPFPVRLDASFEANIVEKTETADAVDPAHAENLSLSYSRRKGDFGLDIQARASYTNRLVSGTDGFDLPGMTVALSMKSHSFRAGDLQLAESAFTVGGFGRRGLEYLFDDQKIYVHLFTAAT